MSYLLCNYYYFSFIYLFSILTAYKIHLFLIILSQRKAHLIMFNMKNEKCAIKVAIIIIASKIYNNKTIQISLCVLFEPWLRALCYVLG